jgi:hypothetical protein
VKKLIGSNSLYDGVVHGPAEETHYIPGEGVFLFCLGWVLRAGSVAAEI